MPQISLTEFLTTTMLVVGDILVLLCAGSSALALLFSFIRQREPFSRFWAGGLFVLLFSIPGPMAKISWPDTRTFSMDAFFPMTNLVGGLLMAGAAVALMAALFVRKRLAYGILS